MTHCFGSFASLSNASSARAEKPCVAIRPKIEVVMIKSLFIRFLPGIFAKRGSWRSLDTPSPRDVIRPLLDESFRHRVKAYNASQLMTRVITRELLEWS